jgi:NodT family efflux transporter outer membrane factor (OMF) lipoprotein
MSCLSRMPSLRPTLAGIAVLALAGCAAGPDFHAPPPPSVDQFTRAPLPAETASVGAPGGAVQRFVRDADMPGAWWSLYRSPALNALVDRARKANADLAAAQSALRAARENYLVSRAGLLPTVDGSYNLNSQKVAHSVASPLADNASIFTLHTAQVSVSYTPDLFGATRRGIESVKAQAEAQRFQTEATYLTLTTNVVAAAVQAATLHDEIAATRQIIGADRDVLGRMRRQHELGELSRGDVATQETLLAQAEQLLPPLQKQYAQAKDQIAALTGRFPSEADVVELSLSDLILPVDLPISLPSRLVAQRPDVQAAEANMHAANALVGVAIANRLPNIALTANGGGAATALGALFSNGNAFWALSGTVTQPIFDGGALKHKQRAAQAVLDQADAQYRSAVLTAFQNVADAL